MKAIKLLFFLTLSSSCLNAQNWQSIPKSQGHLMNPTRFVSNPYLNQLWFITDLGAVVIESNGEVHYFDQTELGSLSVGTGLNFAFTPGHIYYANNVSGLFSFDNYVRNPIYSTSDIVSIRSNEDTVYLVSSTVGFKKYYETGMISTNKQISGLAVKNDFIYCDIGVLAQISGPNNTDWNLLYYDPQYMSGAHREFKFSRLTDTLFVCGKKGISYAYNYDFLDTIAPSNSVNMPARNVLEIEFDHLDRLWAVFGDASNKAFALARYDNGTWVEKYDASNCPINFATYRGFEIDTLGNIWVVDNYNLHTLITPNSPQWLSTESLSTAVSMEVYPNPSSGIVHISSAQNFDFIAVYDCMGRLVYSEKTANIQSKELNLALLRSGNYTVEVHSGDFISRKRFMLLH